MYAWVTYYRVKASNLIYQTRVTKVNLILTACPTHFNLVPGEVKIRKQTERQTDRYIDRLIDITV